MKITPDSRYRFPKQNNPRSKTKSKRESEESAPTPENNGIATEKSIWRTLAAKYDIRHATADELREISTALYHAGQISLFNHAILTFDPAKSPMLNLDINLTPADRDGRRDWIAEYEARLKRDLKQNNLQAALQHHKIIEILKRLDKRTACLTQQFPIDCIF
ncbi:MAG: hypothetical protein GX075_10965 [Firmicutes bacterium]|nr:hypothetical protein [Bacillota bacterium]